MTLQPIREFVDEWKGKAAHCMLLGQGEGPADEAIRMVYKITPRGPQLFYLRSYRPGLGNAERALRHLRGWYGPVHVREATNETMAFHEHMASKDIVHSIRRD